MKSIGEDKKKCDKKRLSAYLDGELDESERATIAKHLKECSRCRDAAQELVMVSKALDVLQGLEPDPGFASRISQEAIARRPIRWLRRAVLPVVASAAAVLSIVLGAFLGQVLYAGWTQENQPQGSGFTDYSPLNVPESSTGEMLGDILGGEG